MRFNPQARRERVWLETKASDAMFERALGCQDNAVMIREEQV